MQTTTRHNDPAKAKEFFDNKLDFTLGPMEVSELLEEGDEVRIFDVRARKDFNEGHVPGAISLPEEDWDAATDLSKDANNIFYCYSIVCHLAARAADKFAKDGFPVQEMEGGWKSWTEHRLKVEK